MNRPTLFFDIDGTLLLFRGLGRVAMQRAMHEVWGIANALEGISFHGGTDGAIAEQIGPGLPRAPMWERYLELFAQAVAATDHAPLPGAVALLDRLAALNVRPALLTGNLRRAAEIKLAAVGLADRFDWDRSGFADDADPRAGIAAAAHARAGGGAAVVIGDAVADVRCGRHIGARVLAVGTGGTPNEDLVAAQPDWLVPDLSATDAIASWLLAPLS